MGKMKELAIEMMNEDDVDDYEYFQLIREAEWKDYVEKEEEELRNQFGNGLTFKLKYQQFLNKNGE